MGLNAGCGTGEWKSWKVGPGDVGSSRRASIYSSELFCLLQIQAYDPELWVWTRDRTKLTQNPRVMDTRGHPPAIGMFLALFKARGLDAQNPCQKTAWHCGMYL
jgi:hypothetical protein